MNIQKQAGAKDCGLFAIANVVSMAMGEDPFNKEFDQGSLRRQLVNSIEQGLTKPFISMDFSRKWRHSKTTNVDIYCQCCGIKGQMIQCEYCVRWYHKECCNVPDKYFMESTVEIS